MSSTLSIYIPRMAAHHDVESIINVMANYRIGAVSHVDFTPINKKPGFGENIDDVVKSAFVHFYEIYTNKAFWDTVLHSDEPYKLQVSLREYWICLKNTRPVQRTMMNIHQIVENGRHLENLITEQAKTIEDQAYKIEELSEKLENVHQVVYQLLGGLFNQSSQCETLQKHTDILFTGKSKGRGSEDLEESAWSMWPTTRQGDDSERRIEVLEKTVLEMIQFESVFRSQEDDDVLLQQRKYENRHEDDSDSTHSSMPELIDDDSDSIDDDLYSI